MKVFEDYLEVLLIKKHASGVRGIHSCVLEESSGRC